MCVSDVVLLVSIARSSLVSWVVGFSHWSEPVYGPVTCSAGCSMNGWCAKFLVSSGCVGPQMCWDVIVWIPVCVCLLFWSYWLNGIALLYNVGASGNIGNLGGVLCGYPYPV